MLKETVIILDMSLLQPEEKKVAFDLKNELVKSLNPLDEAVETKYILEIGNITKSESAGSIERSGQTSRYNFNINMQYNLTNSITGKKITNATVSETAGYSVNSNIYSTHVASKYAEKKAASLMAKKMKRILVNIYSEMQKPDFVPNKD
jgi:hypothetical protein